MDPPMSKSVSFRELEEQEKAEQNPLRDLFASSSSRVINQSDHLYEEVEPQARWVLPNIKPSEVYNDLAIWHLKAATRITIKETVSSIEENSERIQLIPILNPKELQAEAKKLGTQFLHLGCLRVGINALVHPGVEAYALVTIRDLTHNKYTDSLIGGIVAPLSNGPVWFDCYPNFSVSVFDETLADILQLQIQTMGFDMRRKRRNIAIQFRGCFRHTSTMFPAVLHAPSSESKTSVVVITDPKNQKIEHQAIKWEDLQFPEHWTIPNPRPLSVQKITNANIREDHSSATLSFPRRSTIDRRRIEAECKKSSRFVSPDCTDTGCSSLVSNCSHVSLFEFAQLVNFNSVNVECPQCKQSVNLQSLAYTVLHNNHNPRTGQAPPSTSVNPCPNPKCSDIPFPHEDDHPHVLMMHLVPHLEDEDPRLTQIFMNQRSPGTPRYGLGYVEQANKLIPESRFKDLPPRVKRPSIPEIQKFYTLMDGCFKSQIT